MTKTEITTRLTHPGIIAIIRADSPDHIPGAAQALYDGGVRAMEVTANTPGALEVIHETSKKFAGRMLVGVGTVLDAETCRAAILSGAEFVVTPTVRAEVIAVCNRYSKPITCGVYTPTEALYAHENGADFVKIFPADQLGPQYIKNILAPLPQLQIVPTGGVTVENTGEFIKAGSVALGIGSSLVNNTILKTQDWKKLTATAEAFVAAINQARS